ncbi:YitT family protein [Ottowia sp.]|uniref:YitT family protein n=1 Tax=Ottowia sp. TaxID=1898956 RepID=UPI002CA1AA80|nr:YitT family protein [Ottowia sp.]HOB65353.1 YitT family protein [Ottowia sp.]HPZ57856.1 YitT family protein [Ottowia sp.]HQD47812.1 YitT family protein [Ottowia sp.]
MSTASLAHRPYEDAQGLLTGTLFVALGTLMFSQAGLLTGGTAGIALLIGHVTGWPFGPVFFVVNLPFYLFAWQRMGKAFTLRTAVAVSLVSLMAWALPLGLSFGRLSPGLAAVLGGLLVGAGLLILFRHRASLGGINVVALFLQDRLGWRAGRVQMLVDVAILMLAFGVTDAWHVALSVLGAVMLNLALAINHRPGRYMAV